MSIIRNIILAIAFIGALVITTVGLFVEDVPQRTANGALGAALFLFAIVILLEFRLQRIEGLLEKQNELLERLASRRPRPKQRPE